jgi:hypothetical protein
MAALVVAIEMAAGAAMPGPVVAAETTTSIAVGVASCEGEVPQCDPAEGRGDARRSRRAFASSRQATF